MTGKTMLHCKGQRATLDELRDVELPAETKTYVPVSHYDLATNIRTVADDMLQPKGYVFEQDTYGLAKDGQRLFALFNYRNGHEDMGLCVGFRNSYDKSMSAGVVVGARVFICDNLAFTGEICVMRKHTKNVKEDLTQSLVGALYRSANNFTEIARAAEQFSHIQLTDRNAYAFFGVMLGMKIMTPTIANEAYRQWDEPKHEEFKPRTAWSAYNACTEALKMSPVHQVLDRHIALHKNAQHLFLEVN